MASKNEYYDRIISSLQSDLTSQKSEISELKSTVARQQEEIEALKSTQDPQQPPHSPLYSKLTNADKSQLLQQAKKECAAMIHSRLEVLPSHYASKREFDTLQTTITKTYLPNDTFFSYKKAQDTRLKSIEEKLNRHFTFFSSDHSKNKTDQTRKASFNFNTIIQFFKNHDPQWLIRIIVLLSIGILSFYLFKISYLF